MTKIYSVLVVLGFILFSLGAITENSGEAQVNTNDNSEIGVTSGTNGQSTGLPVGVADFTDPSLDAPILPQEPYPQETPDLYKDDDLVPPTPTVGDIHFMGVGAGGAAAAAPMDNEDLNNMDSTPLDLDYNTDAPVTNAVSKSNPSPSEIDRTSDKGSSSSNLVEESKVSVLKEVVPSTEAEVVLSGSKDVESATENYRPLLDEILQTQTPGPEKSSKKLPSSEGDLYNPAPTETLKPTNPSTYIPVGLEGMNPQSVDDVVVPTHFSLDDEDGKQKLGEEDFPTFDKWSMQYLAEQEKEEIKKKQEQAVNPGMLQIQKKLRRNFAARSCGAKVSASNPEAENVNFVLNMNPDEYMISPCKAKKWFVVELCEPVQIHKIELGTTELFSSLPKSFRASASQRYPTKEWITLGKFEMPRERKIHTFGTQLNEEFVKFVRVEMLEHHGDEYYCPITTFRVLGVDMASDEEDEDNDHEVPETNEEAAGETEEEDEMEESANLFTSAKETVVQLVKKVLYKGNQKDGKEEHTTPDNATGKAEVKKDDSVPCAEKSTVFVVQEVPAVQIPDAGVSSPLPEPEATKEIPIITKLADTEQLPMVTIETPIIIKLDKDIETRGWDYHMYDTPDLCFHSPWNFYIQKFAYSKSTCPARPKPHVQTEVKPSFIAEKSTLPTESLTKQMASLTTDNSEIKDVQKEEKLSEINPPSEEVSHKTEKFEEGKKDVDQKSSPLEEKPSITSSQKLQNGAKVILATDRQQKLTGESVFTTHLTSLKSSGVSVSLSEALEPSSLLGQTEVEDRTVSLMTPGLDIRQSQVVEQSATNLAESIFLKVSPSPTLTSEDSMEADGDLLLETPTADQQVEDTGEDIPQQPLDADHLQDSEGQGSQSSSDKALDRNETSPTGSSRVTKPIDLIKVGLGSSSSKRDTSVLKLNNRIMALEQNVSMTKKYLEELSRAFKQQNEEMMRLLNKTEKRLTTYITQSEERDQRQQAHIDILEVKLSNFTQLVDTLQGQIDTMGKELRGAQFLLAFFQAVLFLWLIITSYRGRSKSPLVYTDHEFLLDTMPTKPTIERAEKGNLQRRNSDTGISSGTEPPGSTLKRQVSEVNIASLGGSKLQGTVGLSGTFLQYPSQAPKKRKKKKVKQLSVGSGSSLVVISKSGNIPTQTHSFSSCAGVLFGTDNSYRSQEGSFVGDSCVMSNKDKGNYEDGEGYQSQHYQHVTVYDNQVPAAAKLNNRILDLKQSKNLLITNSGTCVATRDLCSVPLGVSGSFPGINRIPSFHQNGYLDLSDIESSESPLTNSSEALTSMKISPEFRLPVYHRHKVRKLAENEASDHVENKRSRIMKEMASKREESKRRRSVGFINPEIGAEFFLAENYMSENRFKFPTASASTASLEPEGTLWKEKDFNKVSDSLRISKSNVDVIHQPPLYCPSTKLQPISSVLTKAAPDCTLALSLLSPTFTQIPSTLTSIPSQASVSLTLIPCKASSVSTSEPSQSCTLISNSSQVYSAVTFNPTNIPNTSTFNYSHTPSTLIPVSSATSSTEIFNPHQSSSSLTLIPPQASSNLSLLSSCTTNALALTPIQSPSNLIFNPSQISNNLTSTSSQTSKAPTSSTTSLKSIPHAPSFIPLHQVTTHEAFISSSQGVLQSLSQLSTKNLPRVLSGHRYVHEHSAAQRLEQGPVIIATNNSCSSSKMEARQHSLSKANTFNLDDSPHTHSKSSHQVHRRQGSLPLSHLKPSRSCEKEPNARKGSFQDSKQKAGPKVKKPPLPNSSGYSKKSQ